PVTVAAFPPFLHAAGGVQANHDPIVQAVDIPVTPDEVGELGFEPGRSPNPVGAQYAGGIPSNLQQLTAYAIAAGYRQVVVCNGERRRNMGMSPGPVVFPEVGSSRGVVRGDPARVED